MSIAAIHVNTKQISIVGTSEELIALAEAILLKAKHPNTMTVVVSDDYAPIEITVIEPEKPVPLCQIYHTIKPYPDYGNRVFPVGHEQRYLIEQLNHVSDTNKHEHMDI